MQIPSLKVDAAMVDLGLQPDGSLEAPADYQEAGWYTGGPEPGEAGVAVVAAHVDSKTGPAPFYELHSAEPGTRVVVGYGNGKSVAFAVTRTEQYAKTAFPASLVYARSKDAELRLITCGGSFDRRTGHYLDNVVVWAKRIS